MIMMSLLSLDILTHLQGPLQQHNRQRGPGRELPDGHLQVRLQPVLIDTRRAGRQLPRCVLELPIAVLFWPHPRSKQTDE